MIKISEIKKYSKKSEYSYSFGAYPTFQLIEKKAQFVECVLIHSKTSNEIRKKVENLCKEKGISVRQNDKAIEKIADKNNIFLIGVFRKYNMSVSAEKNHIVLVNPSDAGNLGTIIRTCVGFGIDNLVIIQQAVDIYNPKTIRASMGAIFDLNFHYFSTFEEYYSKYSVNRKIYSFMLKGDTILGKFQHDERYKFSLVFGNEASGLDDSFLNIGKSVVINHTNKIDSLNLSLATGIAIYEFTKNIIS